MQRANLVRAGAAFVLLAALTIAVLGSRTSPAADVPARPDLEPYTLPVTQIISFGQGVGRLDTSNGAIFSLAGDLDRPGSSGFTWMLRVPPVDRPHSGLLDIQRPTFNDPDAIFLVDIIEGHTWLLRLRRATSDHDATGVWVPVDLAPSARQALHRY